jgi:polyphosphate glucokinase
MHILGIDIGGSGIKGALVDTETGALVAPRHRLPTPANSRPQPMAQTVAKIVRHFDWTGPLGIGFPAIVHGGVIYSAANISKKWIGVNAQVLFSEEAQCPAVVVNDADSAGVAEMTFGAGRGHIGTVLIITIGTGLGSALFTNGHLVPNTEFGHIEINGVDAETRASDAARKREKLSWSKWTRRFNKYLQTLEMLLSPDLVILGGGVSKEHADFLPSLTLRCPIVPATLLNEAGIVGAALTAERRLVLGSEI